MVALLDSLAEFVTHLDLYDTEDYVAFVHHFMPAVLTGDYDEFHAAPPVGRDGMLNSMAFCIKCLLGVGPAQPDPLAWKLEGLILSLACICCENPNSDVVGKDAGFMCAFAYHQAGLIPENLHYPFEDMARDAVLVQPWWGLTDALALFLLVRQQWGHSAALVQDLLTEWRELHAEEIAALRQRSDGRLDSTFTELDDEPNPKDSLSVSSRWGRFLPVPELRQALCEELVRAVSALKAILQT